MSLSLRILQMVLSGFGVDTDSWGTGGARTVNDLLKEILGGESHLRISGSSIARVVEIVKMFIYDPSCPERGCLLEWGQYLPDGHYRERKQNPSGKMKGNESPKECLVREIKEELNLDRNDYHLSALPPKVESRPSRSYPNLTCLYIIHGFKVTLNPGSSALQDSFTVREKDGTTQLFKWERSPQCSL